MTDSGVPVLQMSGNKSYFYSMQTKSWHLIPPSGLMNGPNDGGGGNKLLLHTNAQIGESNSAHHHQMPLDEIQTRQQSSK